jgi:hypothetical protein
MLRKLVCSAVAVSRNQVLVPTRRALKQKASTVVALPICFTLYCNFHLVSIVYSYSSGAPRWRDEVTSPCSFGVKLSETVVVKERQNRHVYIWRSRARRSHLLRSGTHGRGVAAGRGFLTSATKSWAAAAVFTTLDCCAVSTQPGVPARSAARIFLTRAHG